MEKPKLRPVEAAPFEQDGQIFVQIHDPARICDKVLVVPHQMMYLLVLMDGSNSIADIQASLMQRFGELVDSDRIRDIVAQLDHALILESDHFRAHVRKLEEAFRNCPVRPPCSAASSYPADAEELAAMLDGYYTGDSGPGLPQPGPGDASLVGLVAPHIDFERGGISYAHAYKALAERCDADLFVIFGTAHYSQGASFILTAKSFETPFGVLQTNAGLADALARRYGRDLFAEELVHRTEHSIEFQVVCLQHALRGRQVEMLPILCCSLEGKVGDAPSPRDVPEVGDFYDALQEVLRASGRRVCTIAGADLSHVGRHFGDEFPLTEDLMGDVEYADRQTLEYIERFDADGFYDNLRSDDNARHVCGGPPIYALLATTPAARCELLDYRQATDTPLERAVTFASLALYR